MYSAFFRCHSFSFVTLHRLQRRRPAAHYGTMTLSSSLYTLHMVVLYGMRDTGEATYMYKI
jgi:hypothetical protein